MKQLYLIECHRTPIFEQLQLEEALLRADERNYLLINRGSPRSIVLGLSGQPAYLLDLPRVRRDGIPVIQRFSGGGTVIVDEDTLFVSFILAKTALPIEPFPEPILRWMADLYTNAWHLPGFTLQENDYTIGSRKCGGNAQYIRKERWLHHTSFLWDYREANMDYLLLPAKRPAYRQDRPHTEFLCRLKDFAPTQRTLIQDLKKELVKRFDMQEMPQEELASIRQRAHRQATHCL
jgi:lipoate---protein ligase